MLEVTAVVREKFPHVVYMEYKGRGGMLRQVVRDNTELQKAVMRSDKSSVDCVCKLMEALVQAPDRMPADLTPWGKLAIQDLSQKSVREIVEEYYLGEVQENV